MYMKTKCSYCSTTSTSQREGDGCHACSRGVMKYELYQENLERHTGSIHSRKRLKSLDDED